MRAKFETAARHFGSSFIKVHHVSQVCDLLAISLMLNGKQFKPPSQVCDLSAISLMLDGKQFKPLEVVEDRGGDDQPQDE